MLILLLILQNTLVFAKKDLREKHIACYRELIDTNQKFEKKYGNIEINKFWNHNNLDGSKDYKVKERFLHPIPENLDMDFFEDFKTGMAHFSAPVFNADKNGKVTKVVRDKDGNCELAQAYGGELATIDKTVAIVEKKKNKEKVKIETIQRPYCPSQLIYKPKEDAKLTFFEGDRTRELTLDIANMVIDGKYQDPRFPIVHYRLKAKLPGKGKTKFYELEYNTRKKTHNLKEVLPSVEMMKAIKKGEEVFQEAEFKDVMTEETDREMLRSMSDSLLYFQRAVSFSHYDKKRYSNDKNWIDSVMRKCEIISTDALAEAAEFKMVYADLTQQLAASIGTLKTKIITKEN